ncbi:MAG: hypothetical protein JSS30_07830 [Verrucomicrobia bacterium]|nr:hypothetical protein [Verrucomicrobiota bacterium]
MSVKIHVRSNQSPAVQDAQPKAKGRFSIWEGICSFFSAIASLFGYKQTATMDDLVQRDISRRRLPGARKTASVVEPKLTAQVPPANPGQKRAATTVVSQPRGRVAAANSAQKPAAAVITKTGENTDPNATHSKEKAQAKGLLAKVSAIVKKEYISEDDVETGLQMIKQLRELNKTLNNKKLGELIDGKEKALNKADVLNALAQAQNVVGDLNAKGDNLTVKDIKNGLRMIDTLEKLDINMDRELKGQLKRVKSELLNKYREPAIEASDALITTLIDVIRAESHEGDKAVLEEAKKWNVLMKTSYNYYRLDEVVNRLEQKVTGKL